MIYIVTITDGYEKVNTPYVGTDFELAKVRGLLAFKKYLEEEIEIFDGEPIHNLYIDGWEDGGKIVEEYELNRNKNVWERLI